MANLLPMIEDPFAFAFSAGQGGVIQDFNFNTHQDVLADVSGNTGRDCFVLIGIESRPPLHLEGHIIPPVLSTFKMCLVFAAYFGDLRQNVINLTRINIHGPDNEHVI